MSDQNGRSEQVKRTHEDGEKMEATLQEKRQKVCIHACLQFIA